MEFGYYPGCALHGSSNDYQASVGACMKALGVGLRELDDWICCGASAAHSINHKLSQALPARNLALAERDGLGELLAPCPMCSMELIKAAQAMRDDAALGREMSEIVELPVSGRTSVLNLIQVFQKVGLDAIRVAIKPDSAERVGGYKAACYYGCLLTRPPKLLQFDDPEQPGSMEEILGAIGVTTVDWNFKTECCGAGMTMANEETVLDLGHKILANAAAHGANCVVVACPMCHVNLDMKQAAVEARHGVRLDMPIYYLSDLVGLALGIEPRALGIDRHFAGKR
ncbi:MAG: CoB--CoM heterodisulfide reductase iron-sulfur subunit B family protein [Candidatus Sumerlaeia bacterium]